MKQLENINNLIARIFLASLFLMAGISKLGAGYAGTQAYMDAMGVSPSLLPLVIILEIGGAIALIVGFKTKLTALLLAGFTLVAAILFHGNFADQMQSILFMKNMAIAGGLLALVSFGGGQIALDAKA
jgi:putative oxidoreductase